MTMMMRRRRKRRRSFFIPSFLRGSPTHHHHHHHLTFVEIQLLVLFVLLLLFGVVLPVGVAVVVGHPLDLAARLLPLSALVQRWLRSLLDEVVGLRLGQDGGPLPLDEQLGGRRGEHVLGHRTWGGRANRVGGDELALTCTRAAMALSGLLLPSPSPFGGLSTVVSPGTWPSSITISIRQYLFLALYSTRLMSRPRP